MFRVFLIFSFFITFSALPTQAEDFSSCCFCITGNPDSPGFETLKKICGGWMKRTTKAQNCELSKSGTKDLILNNPVPNTKCEKIHIFGSFHGRSKDANLPFEISKALAHSYSAKEACYDGSSCLVFNNVDDVQALSAQLAKNSSVSYSISGNQNVGTCRPDGDFSEIIEESSKITAVVRQATVQVSYAECTKSKDAECYITNEDDGAKNDSNAKKCMSKNQLVEQTCCHYNPKEPSPINSKIWIGFWGAPGNGCN